MVLGGSGSGKTTLLKLIKRLLVPQGGQVHLLGLPQVRIHARARLDPRVAYIPQQLGLVRSRTVLDNVLTGALGSIAGWRGLLGIYPSDVVRRAHDLLDTLGIGHKAGDKVRTLSGGERQRVAIARALLQQPHIILADEFVSQLDPATTTDIMHLVQAISRGGVTVFMTTHELDLVERFAETVIVLRDGDKVLDSPATEVAATELAALMKP
jgi:phosphonate transport system ATP-binding protein